MFLAFMIGVNVALVVTVVVLAAALANQSVTMR